MAEIPKNVMQIGQTDAHIKVYMEDYVHTFLERCEGCCPCLAFGRKEEAEGVSYYLIYGVEKRQDWERGNFPYFKNLERIGEIERKDGGIRFKTVQGREIPIQGYFIFYEQNEDMQSYMIAERENRDAETQRERERVMEEVQLRREKRRQEAGQQGHPAEAENGKRDMSAVGRALRARYLRANAAVSRKTARKKPDGSRVTLAGACRAGCLALLLILAATALTSLNRYPDMKAVIQLFADAAEHSSKKENTSLVVEEAAPDEAVDKAILDDAGADDIPVQADGEVQWMIGGETQEEELRESEAANPDETAPPDAKAQMEAARAPETEVQEQDRTQSEAEYEAEEQDVLEPAEQSTSAAENYTVQKGDSLARIARRFYGSASYVSKICDLNQIEDPDRITPGQNILLP